MSCYLHLSEIYRITTSHNNYNKKGWEIYLYYRHLLTLTNATILWAETGKLQRSDNVKIYPTQQLRFAK